MSGGEASADRHYSLYIQSLASWTHTARQPSMDKYIAVFVCLVAWAAAEPPASRYAGYSAPSSKYGAPGVNPFRGNSLPSSNYGLPGFSQFTATSQSPSQYQAPFVGYGRDDGNSEPANYEFNYDVDAPEYGVKFGHQEARQGDVAQGKYYVLLPDGRTQVVEYVADQDGYRPKISYHGGGGNGYGRGPQRNFGGY